MAACMQLAVNHTPTVGVCGRGFVGNLRERDNLPRADIIAVPKVSAIRRFHCTLLANNREEENRDGRPSHFLSFSYCFKLLTCCIRPEVTQTFARRARKAPLEYRRMINFVAHPILMWVWFRWMLAP